MITMATKKPIQTNLEHTEKSAALRSLNPVDLRLDPYNPRLSAEEEGSSQEILRQIIIEKFKIEELAESIVSAGYLSFDPIIGATEGNTIIILEGNRRVATLQLLIDPSLAPAKYRERWQALSKQLPSQTQESIKAIAVQVYPDGKSPEIESYIGFRHVTGVLQWPALEKASFIARLIGEKWSYRKIADRLGSYPKTVEKHFVGFRIAEQAKDMGLPGADRLAGSFGVLMRALQAPGIISFLGISFPGDPRQSSSPVPQDRVENFKDFIAWTFGTDEKNRIITDSRQLTKWGKILASSEAVAYLRRSPSPSFDKAWFRSGGEEESLLDSLLQAVDSLGECIPLIPLHREEQAIQNAVERSTHFMLQILRYFPDIKTRFEITGNV